MTLMRGAQANPRETARYVDLIQDDTQRGQIVGAIAAQWYTTDQGGAIRWLHTRPRGDEYDTAVAQMAHRFQRLGPTEHCLIDGISDVDLRDSAYFSAISSISRNDPARALRLLQEIPLPADRRQRLEEHLQRRIDNTKIRVK